MTVNVLFGLQATASVLVDFLATVSVLFDLLESGFSVLKQICILIDHKFEKLKFSLGSIKEE